MTKNPLMELVKHADSSLDLSLRQIGFCARWCLDNYCTYGLVKWITYLRL